MLEYWWLILLPVLILIVSPLGSAATEWRALRQPRRAAAGDGMASGDVNSDIVADFVWIGMLLTAFLILIHFRP